MRTYNRKAQDKTCPLCNGNFDSRNYNKHVTSCKGVDPRIKQEFKYMQLPDGKFGCICCNKTADSRQKITSHWWRSHTKEGSNHKGGDITKYSGPLS